MTENDKALEEVLTEAAKVKGTKPSPALRQKILDIVTKEADTKTQG